jgi:hypothetical protein
MAASPLDQLAEAVADFEIGEEEAVNGHHDLRSGEAGISLAGRRSLLPTSCLSKRRLAPPAANGLGQHERSSGLLTTISAASGG